METTVPTSNSKTKALLIVISAIAFIFFMASILLQLTPTGMLKLMEDFAIHHYFLMGFISLVVFAICQKAFITLDKKINRRYLDSKNPALTKNIRRKIRLANMMNSKNKNVIPGNG